MRNPCKKKTTYLLIAPFIDQTALGPEVFPELRPLVANAPRIQLPECLQVHASLAIDLLHELPHSRRLRVCMLPELSRHWVVDLPHDDHPVDAFPSVEMDCALLKCDEGTMPMAKSVSEASAS